MRKIYVIGKRKIVIVKVWFILGKGELSINE